MLYSQKSIIEGSLSDQDLKEGLYEALSRIGPRRKVLAIPPDMSRFHSKAGLLTQYAWNYFGGALTDILPAIGTHAPMSSEEISRMYGDIPQSLFRIHNWRKDVVTLGIIPAEVINRLSENKLSFDWPAQVNRLLLHGGFDLILSIGQVVPHEVIGMANYNKNIFIGTGGCDSINKSHYLGAVYGLERMMGRADTPVRELLNLAEERFAADLPILYVHTVIGSSEKGEPLTKGLFIGDDTECFYRAAELSQNVNITFLDKAPSKIIAYLDPSEFKSTWIGNKAIYRSRMAIAEGGELVIIAPGVKEFGEDEGNDRLIRKYGYVGTDRVLELVEKNEDLRQGLGTAAHLIHGSSEGKFTITYSPGHLSEEEIKAVNFRYAEPGKMLKLYDPEKLTPGYNTLSSGEEVYFIKNPGLGLWTTRERF